MDLSLKQNIQQALFLRAYAPVLWSTLTGMFFIKLIMQLNEKDYAVPVIFKVEAEGESLTDTQGAACAVRLIVTVIKLVVNLACRRGCWSLPAGLLRPSPGAG